MYSICKITCEADPLCHCNASLLTTLLNAGSAVLNHFFALMLLFPAVLL